MSPIAIWCPSLGDLALPLLTTVALFFPGLSLAAPSTLTPKTAKRSPTRGDRGFMYGFKNPSNPEPNGANALVLVQSLSSGTFGYTQLVRGLGTGLSGCEIVCVRKTSGLRDPSSVYFAAARNEVVQHSRIQSEVTNDIFFARLLGHRESSWPGWKTENLPDSQTPHSVELYQEFIHGRTLKAMTHNMAPLEKEDVLSAYAFALKHTFAAMERLNGLSPPLEHKDLNEQNIMIGWTGGVTPSITESSLGEMRTFIIDYGLTTAPDPNPNLRLDSDFKKIRAGISNAFEFLGVRPSVADKTASQTQQALQMAWHLLFQAMMSMDADRKVSILGKLRKYLDFNAPEKYSEGFRNWFPELHNDPQAKPILYASQAELTARGRLHRVAGPWHPVQVEFNGVKWEVIRFFEELWCERDQCVEGKLNIDPPT